MEVKVMLQYVNHAQQPTSHLYHMLAGSGLKTFLGNKHVIGNA
jgi:hypothetical protein